MDKPPSPYFPSGRVGRAAVQNKGQKATQLNWEMFLSAPPVWIESLETQIILLAGALRITD